MSHIHDCCYYNSTDLNSNKDCEDKFSTLIGVSESCGGEFACVNDGQYGVLDTKTLNFVTGCYSLLHTQILGLRKAVHT